MAKFHEVNKFASDVSEVMFSLMTQMIAAGWTHVASSDGTTFSTVANQIAAAADLAPLNAFWILQDPGGRRQYAYQRTGAGGGNGIFRYSALDGFVTGGDATTLPTATDQQEVRDGATLFGNTADLRYHVVVESTPINDVYPFWVGAWGNGTQNASTMIVVDALLPGSFPSEPTPSAPTVGDPDPTCMVAFPGGTPALIGASTDFIGSSLSEWRMWYKYNYAGEETWVTATGYPFGGQNEVNGSLGNNPYSKEVDLLPFLWCRATSDFGSEIGHKGISGWIKWAGRTRDTGEAVNLDSDAYFHYNDLLLPWPENEVPQL